LCAPHFEREGSCGVNGWRKKGRRLRGLHQGKGRGGENQARSSLSQGRKDFVGAVQDEKSHTTSGNKRGKMPYLPARCEGTSRKLFPISKRRGRTSTTRQKRGRCASVSYVSGGKKKREIAKKEKNISTRKRQSVFFFVKKEVLLVSRMGSVRALRKRKSGATWEHAKSTGENDDGRGTAIPYYMGKKTSCMIATETARKKTGGIGFGTMRRAEPLLISMR